MSEFLTYYFVGLLGFLFGVILWACVVMVGCGVVSAFMIFYRGFEFVACVCGRLTAYARGK